MRPHIHTLIMACEQRAHHFATIIMIDSVSMLYEFVIHGERMSIFWSSNKGISCDLKSPIHFTLCGW